MTMLLNATQRRLLAAVFSLSVAASVQAQEGEVASDPAYEQGADASTQGADAAAPEAVTAEEAGSSAEPVSDEGNESAVEPVAEAPVSEAAVVETIEVEPLREAEAPETPAEEEGTTKLEAIEVTGSRIRRIDYETSQPVTVVTREDIERTGLSNIGDLLQELPSAGSALNRAFNNGGAGTAEVDLRNLGSQRVLVLVDGRRWIPGVGNYPAVDLNTIPASIVERIEVLKDGASAVYGSDAITGVINIITRKDFVGSTFQAQANAFEQGDGLQQQYSANWGTVSDDTSIFVDINFVRQAEVSASDREISEVPLFGTGFTRGSLFSPRGSILFIPNAANGSILGTELCPDLAPEVVNGTLEDEGLPGGIPAGAPVGGLQLCNMILQQGQTITGDPSENTATVAGRYEPRDTTSLDPAVNDNYNYAPINYLLTPFEQASLFTQISQRLFDSVQFTGRALYNRHKTERNLAETPLLFGDLTFPPYNSIYIAADQLYNPFDQDIGTHAGQGTAADQGLGPGLGIVGRRFVEAGPRFISRTTETLFLTGALQGDFSILDKFMTWDVGYANGRILNSNLHRGDLNMERVKLALGPAADCVAPCVPLNLFGGPGTITQDQLDYVLYEAASSAEGNLQYVWAGIGGEISDFGFLAAPLGIAMGVEYRTESFENQPDPFVQSGISSTNIQRATRGDTSVKEAYIEFDVPLLADLPGIQELGLSLAGRYSDYGRFDPATTGKVGLRWKPIDDILLRGTYSQAFRAPSVVDLFLGDADGYPELSDPCVGPEAGSVEEQNCEADGVNTTTSTQLGTQILTRFGGNPDLEPETATSYTAGLVFSPEFIPEFTVTVDYYSIEAEDFISNLAPDFILDSCYSQPRDEGTRPVTCDFVIRNSGGSIAYIKSPSFNFARVETSGFEVAMEYLLPTAALGEFAEGLGTFKLMFDSSYLDKFDQYTPNADGSSTKEAYAGTNQGDTPLSRFKFNTTLQWTAGQWDASWTARYIYHTIEDCDDGFEPSLSSLGLCSQPDDDLTDTTDDSKNELETIVYHNVQLNYEIPGWETKLTLGVINLLDQDPPISYTAFANSFPGTLYEAPGRQPYVKLQKRF
ncbi:MAG: TonB-dependent receptor [Sinimarinibacterium sp.]|jgi:iron complex outermembrane receptor protein